MAYKPPTPRINPSQAATIRGEATLPPANKPVPKTFAPVSNIVAGWVEPKPDTTASGLALSNASTYTTPIVRVVAVGPECKYVKEGMRILTPAKVAAMAVYVGEHAYVCLFEESVIGILPPADETNEQTTQPVA